MSGKRVATSFLAAAMAVGTLSSAAFAENGTVDPADLNWESQKKLLTLALYGR
mgnify:FL=1